MTDKYDVVIIGGGINGVGVAQAVACNGLSVLLLEKTALASGTSSKSSKLIHGGLRYLETMSLSLVKESLKERAILLKIAPDLVKILPFHIPIYKDSSRSPLTLHAGLSLYSLLGGLAKHTSYKTIKKTHWVNLDGLKTDNLNTVFQYYDAQTDDKKLTEAVMQSAISLGAELQCPAEVISAQINKGDCEVQYVKDGINKSCKATVLINAAGPWVNDINALITPKPKKTKVDLVQGSHLVLAKSLSKKAYYLEAPQDKRAVFLLPWGKKSLLGTTEHLFKGNPNEISVLQKEEDYLLNVFHHYFPNSTNDVIDKFSGCRVLPCSNNGAFKSSRETLLIVDDKHQPKYLSIYGGKLTTYRATAQKVIKIIAPSLPKLKKQKDTSELTLPLV